MMGGNRYGTMATALMRQRMPPTQPATGMFGMQQPAQQGVSSFGQTPGFTMPYQSPAQQSPMASQQGFSGYGQNPSPAPAQPDSSISPNAVSSTGPPTTAPPVSSWGSLDKPYTTSVPPGVAAQLGTAPGGPVSSWGTLNKPYGTAMSPTDIQKLQNPTGN